MKKLILTVFIITALVQLYVPLSMIAKSEFVLEVADVYKFKTAPVDPVDAFRGRYVALSISGLRSRVNPRGFESGDKIYATILTDSEGFSTFGDFSSKKPKGPYLMVDVSRSYKDSFSIRNPFDRYYINEKLAPEAEKAYREHSRRGKHDAYISVRIKDGKGVIEGLYIGDQRIEDYIKNSIGGEK